MTLAAANTGTRRRRRLTRRLLLGLAGALLLYPIAALTLGLIPVNAGFRQADAGVAIYVRGNGVHTDLVLPHIHRLHDWRGELPQGDGALWRRYVSFGWGDRGFFQETPRWRDLRASVAFVALTGLGASAMRVEFTDSPILANGDAVLRLSDEQYLRLVASIRASFRRDARERLLPMAAPAYARDSLYFEAAGSYSLLRTCNDWTRAKLTDAGVRMPAWAPFYPAIFYHLRKAATPSGPAPWKLKIEERGS